MYREKSKKWPTSHKLAHQSFYEAITLKNGDWKKIHF